MSRVARLPGILMGVMLATAQPASAQCRLCDKPNTESAGETKQGQIDLQLETRLDFASLIVLGSGEGTATLRPDGSRVATGTLGDISGRAMVGSVAVRGEPGRAIKIELPRTIAMHSVSGNEIAIEEIISDLPSLPRLDSSGVLTFRFGGRLKVTGDGEGDYRGDLPITVDYL